MNPQNGKGDKRLHARQQCSDEQMQSNWDKAFGKKKKPSNEPKKQSDSKS